MKNLGPRSQAMPAEAGITIVEGLSRIGSEAAYCLAKRPNAKVRVNLLWGNRPWQQFARAHRTSLLLAVEEFEKND